MSKELTPKQEKFVRNLIQGMSQREAYKNSYDAENMLDKTIDEKACILFADDKIKTRYRELQEEANNKAIMSAIERKIWLTKVINNEYTDEAVTIHGDIVQKLPSMTDKMRALDLLNKMDGEYIQKIEADVNNDVNINITLEDDTE